MTTNDPISDMLTRIRNASMVKKIEVEVPFSKVKMKLAEILLKEGYFSEVRKVNIGILDAKNTKSARGGSVSGGKIKSKISENGFANIVIGLKYDDQKKPIVKSIKRISKPGRRVYRKNDELPLVLNNFGIAIISTSSGIMTNREARKKGLGGEIICEVY